MLVAEFDSKSLTLNYDEQIKKLTMKTLDKF